MDISILISGANANFINAVVVIACVWMFSGIWVNAKTLMERE